MYNKSKRSVEMLYEISFFELDELLTFVLKIREKNKD